MPTASETLERVTDDALRRIWTQYPAWGTWQGIHDGDHLLEDWSPESREAFLADLRELRERLATIDLAALPADQRRDARLLAAGLTMHADDLTVTRAWERNPGQLLSMALDAIFTPMVREYAPMATRLAAIQSRCKLIPRVCMQARQFVVPELVPPQFVDYVEAVAQGAPSLLGEALTAFAGGPVAEAKVALDAVRDLAEWARLELAPRAGGNFALGRAAFEKKLHNDHFLPYDAPGLRALGERVWRETRALMEESARAIAPGKSVAGVLRELSDDHVTPESALGEYRGEMERAKQFVIDRRLATIPDGESLEVIETPAFMRAITPYAAYMSPAPYEKEQKGLFFVTVPQDEEALRGHDRAGLPITSLHEGYPGHHLQLVWQNRHPSRVRKEFGNTCYAEGWALYCEEMMYETGFYTDPRQRLRQLKDVLWRAGRVMLDVDLHTGAISFDRAVDFLVDEAYVERPNARAEVLRYCMTPTQPMSYVVGKVIFLELREQVRARQGAKFELGAFHDAILATSTVPAPLAAEEVLERAE